MITTTILKAGPGQLVEYLPDLDADALAETLVAFVNGDGGTIVAGLDEHGKPTGPVPARPGRVCAPGTSWNHQT